MSALRSFLSLFVTVVFIVIVVVQTTRIEVLAGHVAQLDKHVADLAGLISKTANTDLTLAEGINTSSQSINAVLHSIDAIQSEILALTDASIRHDRRLVEINQLLGHGRSYLKGASPDDPVYFEFGSPELSNRVAGLDYRTPGDPFKPWRPEMCETARAPSVSKAYIYYCIRESKESPDCQISMPPHSDGAQYFENLDCSWHKGTNPREDDHAELR